MALVDELTFEIDLPHSAAETRARLDAACDSDTIGGFGTGLLPLWGNVGDTWFRLRAIGVSLAGPVAEGYVVPSSTGSRVKVSGELDPEGARLARDTRWGFPLGAFAALIGLASPGGLIPGLVVGAVFVIGAWTGRRWQYNAARKTRRVLMEVLTGPPPQPVKWRPRLPVRRAL